MNTPMIVAEMSANHLGSLGRALDIITEAARSGADAIKLQTFSPAQMAGPSVVIESGPWAGRRAIDLYAEAMIPRHWYPELIARAHKVRLHWFSSVFHPDDVDFLETLGCPMYKIASFEINDLALIEHAARTGKPVIISTGMATEEEIKYAIDCAARAGAKDVTILKCTSAYPAPLEDANLETIGFWNTDIGSLWQPGLANCRAGLSDHTLGHTAAVVATALGATMIEKHLTLSRDDGGPDAAFSAEPLEFRAMVKAVREAHKALGTVHYGPTDAEQSSLQLRRASGGKRGDNQ